MHRHLRDATHILQYHLVRCRRHIHRRTEGCLESCARQLRLIVAQELCTPPVAPTSEGRLQELPALSGGRRRITAHVSIALNSHLTGFRKVTILFHQGIKSHDMARIFQFLHIRSILFTEPIQRTQHRCGPIASLLIIAAHHVVSSCLCSQKAQQVVIEYPTFDSLYDKRNIAAGLLRGQHRRVRHCLVEILLRLILTIFKRIIVLLIHQAQYRLIDSTQGLILDSLFLKLQPLHGWLQ